MLFWKSWRYRKIIMLVGTCQYDTFNLFNIPHFQIFSPIAYTLSQYKTHNKECSNCKITLNVIDGLIQHSCNGHNDEKL